MDGVPRRSQEIARRLAALGAPRRTVSAGQVKVMLAEIREEPFSAAGWIFELKHDGFRLLAAREQGRARLVYRRGSESTAAFPEVARAMEELPYGDLILDGEVVVLDETGRSSFQGLQKRVQLIRRPDLERAAAQRPATLFAFDLLAFEGHDLRPLPLRARKELLALLLPASGPIRYADHVEEQGRAFFEEVRRLGLEGMVGKRADAPYAAGRSASWLKVRAERSADFVVVGFTEPDGVGRPGFGSLHLGAYDAEELVYCGRAGSGFTEKQLNDLRRTLDAMVRPAPACGGPLPPGRGHVWVEPRLVCEVRFKQWTEEGLLRQPVFLRLRDDKEARECAWEGPLRVGPLAAAPPRARDLAEYYRAAARWMLPYLADRLVSRGAIAIEIPSSRVSGPDQPDWSLLDLEARGAAFAETVALALALKALADDIGLPAFVKTSGAAGLHVLIPLGAGYSHEQSRSLAQLMAWVVVREHGAKVHLDPLRNGPGQLVAAPYSVCPGPQGWVSAPLAWSEVTPELDPARFTLRTMAARLEQLGADPMAGLLAARPDLRGALERLERRLVR
jgi:bifunctional non-homologous end joining protein LigD